MTSVRKILLEMAFISICIGLSSAYAGTAPESFVDEIVYSPFLFEEDPADEFLAEKQEINRIFKENEFNSALYDRLHDKVEALDGKETAKYGEEYVDFDVEFAFYKMSSMLVNVEIKTHLQSKYAEYGDALEDKLRTNIRDEDTYSRMENKLHQIFKNANLILSPMLYFMIDKNLMALHEEFLGKADASTLRYSINLIRDYSLLGDSKTALAMEQNLLPKLEKVFGTNSPEVAEVLSLMAYDHKTLGNYLASEETLMKVIAINKELHGEERSPRLFANLIALAELRKATPASDPVLYAALERAAKNLPEDDLAKIYVGTMNGSYDWQQYSNLLEFNSQELKLIGAYSRDYHISLVEKLLEESEGARLLGYYSNALTRDLLAMSWCKTCFGTYHHKTLMSFCNLSDDYLRLNQPENALTLAQKAFSISQRIYGDEHPCTVYAIHSLTNAYRKLGRYEEALELDKKSYRLCARIFVQCSVGEPQKTLMVLTDLADDYRGLKNYPAAIKIYEDFLAKCDTYDVKGAEVQKNLARLYNLAGEYEKTVQLYDFLKTAGDSYSLDNLPISGLTAAHTADVLLDALTIIGQRKEKEISLAYLDYNDVTDEYESVISGKIKYHIDVPFYRQVIEKFEDIRYNDNHYYATYSTSETQQEWFSQTVPYYKKVASFFVSQNENDRAFKTVELCKGRTLVDQYRELLATYQSGLSEEERLKLNEYRKKIPQYKDKFSREFKYGNDALKFNLMIAHFKIIDEYNSYKNQLIEKYPKYAEILTDEGDEFSNTKQLSDIIASDHCYISYSVVKKDEASNTRENEILAFVVDDNGEIKSFSIAVDEEFFDTCNLYRDLLQYPNLNSLNRAGKYLRKKSDGRYILTETSEPLAGTTLVRTAEGFSSAKQELSARLGEKLLAPLAEHISTKTTWIISPDSELNVIPFETLQFNGKMAIESADICYVPSLTVLKLMKEAGDKNRQLAERMELFAMGNAVYGKFGEAEKRGNDEIFAAIQRSPDSYFDLTQLKWKNLDGTGRELEKVSTFFPTNTQKMMTGSAASERNLKQLDKSGELAQYKLILLATHGLFIPERPDLNAIVLSQIADEENDGYVTVGEWMGYNLNSDLIYLSACESGRGDYYAGEGIIGLPYALTVAGNKDTVMSLWKVDDAATAEFTSAVFEKLSRGVPEVRALNETKREFLRNPSANLNSSSVWAAFLLYGF